MPTGAPRGRRRRLAPDITVRAGEKSLASIDEGLVKAVPSLAPEALHALVRHRGLDASAELAVAATPAQLTAVFDIDLWRRSDSGGGDEFDADRFGEWLEALVSFDRSAAARAIAALDSRLVIVGLSRHVRVFDRATLVTSTGDDEVSDGASSFDGPSCEVYGYVVRASRPDAWDAIVTLLFTLADDHPDSFHAVMRGCRRLSNSTPEVDGLDELLLEREQAVHDAAVERDDRRAPHGYVTAADARAFLQLARQQERDAGARRFMSGAGTSSQALTRRTGATEDAAFTRDRELAFLANVLMTGCSIQSRKFTPQEAVDAAAAVCGLGFEYRRETDSFANDDQIAAFQTGWAVMHALTMFVARRLIGALDQLHCVDVQIQDDLGALRHELVRQCENDTPWLARHLLDVVAVMDIPVFISLQALLSECPVVPDALTATLEHRAGPISQTAFQFISTERQVQTVQQFADGLLATLR